MNRRWLIAAAAGLALAGCGLSTAYKEGEALARAVYARIRTGADLSQDVDLAANLRTPQGLAELAALRKELPSGDPISVSLRSWRYAAGKGGARANLMHAYRYPTLRILVGTTLVKDTTGGWKVAGFVVTVDEPMNDTAIRAGDFKAT